MTHNLKKSKNILIRSSWQTVNIGDIGHTFGLVRLLTRALPEVSVTLWPVCIDRGVKDVLLNAFPQLEIVEGTLSAELVPSTPALAEAIERADILLHGSGPSVVALDDLYGWKTLTNKPYMLCGVTIDPVSAVRTGNWEGGTLEELEQQILGLGSQDCSGRLREVLSGADAIFLRDSLSLQYIRKQGFTGVYCDLGPDATFACDDKAVAKADCYLQSEGLVDKGFICIVPRLRWTPYYKIHGTEPTPIDLEKDAINERTRCADHAGLRALIVEWVRRTGHAVLLCPEMTYQVELAREELLEPLPDDVRAKVVWRDHYWLNDEAAAIYARARAVVSIENHSPIFALAQGTPSFYLRQPTDTVKGQMWKDVGLGDWFLEIGQADGDALWQRVSAIDQNYAEACCRVKAINQTVNRCHNSMLERIRSRLRTC